MVLHSTISLYFENKTCLVLFDKKSGKFRLQNSQSISVAPKNWEHLHLKSECPFFRLFNEDMRTSYFGYDNWKLVKGAKLNVEKDSGCSSSSNHSKFATHIKLYHPFFYI